MMEITEEDLLQIQLNIISDCLKIVEANRGRLDVADMIMKHYGMVRVIPEPTAKPKLELVK
jgi:hypothetical protein